jgi:hypothetical protein
VEETESGERVEDEGDDHDTDQQPRYLAAGECCEAGYGSNGRHEAVRL